MNKALVIFNENGTIMNQTYGDVTAPRKVISLVVDVPDGKQIHHIDMTDPENPEVVFEDMIEFDFVKIRKEIDGVKVENEVLRSQLSAAENTITDTQLALTEQYEANLALQDELTNVQLALTEIYEGGNV